MSEEFKKITPVQRFFRLLQQDRKDVIYIYVFAIFNGVVNLSLPLGIQAIIGFILTGSVSSSWLVLVTIVLIGIAFTGVLQILQLSILEKMQQRMFTRASFEFAYRLPRFKQETIWKYDVAELINRFFDILTVQKSLPKVLLDFSTSVLNIMFGLILLSIYHPFFIFFGLIMVGILLIMFYFTAPHGLRTSINESSQKYKSVYWLEEIAHSLTTFKMAGRTDFVMKETDRLSMGYLNARKAHFKVILWQFIQSVTFKTLITGGLLILGGLLVMRREINIGQFVAGEIIIITIINAVEKIILSLQTIYDLLTGLEKLGQVMDIELEQGRGEQTMKLPEGSNMQLKMADLRLHFAPQKRTVLSGVDLEIAAGEKVCISGNNGSGKTALMHVLGSIYTEFSGMLAYEGLPASSLDLESLRFRIGDNFNQESLFSASLVDNITLGREGISQDDLQTALKVSGLSEVVNTLPNGLFTIMDPANRNLHPRVITRIFLARSIVHRPSLLLLDDLYDLSELADFGEIITHMTSQDRDWTLVVASNDPMVAAQCERTVFMEEGKVELIGSFEDIVREPKVAAAFGI